MKILVILHESSLSGANLGLLESLASLEGENIEFVFCTPSYGSICGRLLGLPFKSSLLIKDYRWWMAGNLPVFKGYKVRNLIRNLICCWDLIKTFRNDKPDIILSHTIVVPVGALLARFLNVKHAWYIHEFGTKDHGLKYIYGRWISYRFLRNYGGNIFANSKVVADYFSKIVKREIPFIYYPVHLPKVYEASNLGYYLPMNKVIMYGRISRSKGHKLAVEALEILHEKGMKINLTIMGATENPSFLEELETFTSARGLSGAVHFLDHTFEPIKEVVKHGIVLNCSRNEAFGRMNIEAMKLGLIMVGANTGSSEELIQEGKTGFLFERNAVALAEKLIQILQTPYEQILEIRTKARLYAITHCNNEEHSRRLLKILSHE